MPNKFVRNNSLEDEDSIDRSIYKEKSIKKTVTFINIVNIIKVESYKKYNKRKY